jgi:RimJ/RimL family protein N-acetyltransferase
MGRFRGVELDGLRVEGKRLQLRPWTRGDAPRVAEVMTDRSMHRFLALPDPYTEADALRYVDDIAVRPRAEGSGLECAVVERSSGRVVGSAALRLHTDPEIGY